MPWTWLPDIEANGIGQDKDDIEKVMAPFTQIGDSMLSREGGTGLGLSIVKALVELHGGRVEIDSALGEGAKVNVYLPKH